MRKVTHTGAAVLICVLVPACGSVQRFFEPRPGPVTAGGRIEYDVWGHAHFVPDRPLLEAAPTKPKATIAIGPPGESQPQTSEPRP